MQADDDLKRDLLKDAIYHFGATPEVIEMIFDRDPETLMAQTLTLKDYLGIADRLGVSLENLVARNVSWATVKKNYHSKNTAVPEEYLRDAGSYMSSLRSMISFITFKYGEKASEAALQHLQISREALMNDGLLINTYTINRLFRFLSDRFCFSRTEIEIMAIMLHRFTPRSAVINLARQCPTNRQIIQTMISNATKYELNFNYWIDDSSRDLVLNSRPKKAISSEADSPVWMDDSVAWFKIATVKHMPALLGRQPMNILDLEIGSNGHFQEFKLRIKDVDSLGGGSNIFH